MVGRSAGALLALTVWAAACSSGPSTPSASTNPPPPPASAPAHLLVVSYAAGFRHSSIDTAKPIVQQLGRSVGAFDTAFCDTSEDVRRMITPEGLTSFDAVLFLNTTGDVGVPDLSAFLTWVAAGHGFAGVHSAADTYHEAPGYLDLLGNEFESHGNQAEVQAIVEAPSHPAVAHLGPRYRVFDEIYRFVRNNRAEVTPLLTLDRYPLDGLTAAGQPADLPLAWAKSYGAGRVFYTALGHRDELWRDPVYQQHVLGGLRWVLQTASRSQAAITASSNTR